MTRARSRRLRTFSAEAMRNIRERAEQIRKRRKALGIKQTALDSVAGCQPRHVEWSERQRDATRVMPPEHPSLRLILGALDRLESGEADVTAFRSIAADSERIAVRKGEVRLWLCDRIAPEGVWLTPVGCDRQHRRAPHRNPLKPDQLHPCAGCPGVTKLPGAQSKRIAAPTRDDDGT